MFPEIPSSLQHVSGYSDNRSSSRVVRDNFFHFNLNASATRFMSWKGQHTLKAGLQFERLGAHLLSGAQQPTITLYWDASRAANDGSYQRGKYGYYAVARTFNSGDPVANNWGLFVQDSWTLSRNLTLNLGIRTEREYAPSYRAEWPGVQFGFGDKIAPRVGFAWDIKGDSRWKAYGSWGTYNDLMKLGLGYVMFGASRSVTYYYHLDTYDWQSIGGDYPPVPGQGYPGTYIDSYDYRTVSNDPKHNMVDPDLKSIRMQEITGGLDHELSSTMSLGIRYAHKWVDYAIEAVCTLYGGQELCGVNNPGFGTAKYPWGTDYPMQPEAVRQAIAEERARSPLAEAQRESDAVLADPGALQPAAATWRGRQEPGLVDAIAVRSDGASPEIGLIFLHGFGGNFAWPCWAMARAARPGCA